MKKRNTFIGLALVIAILVLGVGYAAISALKFTVNGTIETYGNPALFKVAFTNARLSEVNNTVGVVASVALDETDAEKRTANFEISNLQKTGDKAEFELTITNSSDELVAEISNFEFTGLDDEKNVDGYNLINASYTFTTEELTERDDNKGVEKFNILPGKSAKLYVQFKLTEPETNPDVTIENVQLTFDATPINLPEE